MSAAAPFETTAELGRFAGSLRYEDIPRPVIELTKATLLDSIGLGLLGAASTPCVALTNYFESVGGVGDARIWRTGLRFPAAPAAWVLSSRICSFALDAVQSRLHAAAVVVGASVATAERVHPSGVQFLAGLTAGMEGLVRIGEALNTTEHYLRGWRPTTTCGPFGAVMAAGSLMGLDAEQMVGAFGIAGDQAAGFGTELSEGSASLVLGPGRAAFSGVLATELAVAGIIGSARILEADFGGFFGTLSSEHRIESVTEGLGSEYRILGLQTKPFPIPASLTTAVECAISLHDEHGFEPASIADVVLHSNRAVATQCGRQLVVSENPDVLGQRAQLSAPYIIATALTDGTFGITHLTDPVTMLRDDVIALARRVRVVVDEALDQGYPAVPAHRVEIRSTDGQTFCKSIEWPFGSAPRPTTPDYMRRRFASHAELAGAGAVVDDIAEVIESLEESSDVTEIFDLLS